MTTEHDDAPPPISESSETSAAQSDEPFPWPPRGDRGFVNAFTTTWRESALQPTRFFRRMPPGGLWPAVLYYVLIGVLAEGARLFWGNVFDATGVSSYLAEFGGVATPAPAERLMNFLFSPLWLVLALFMVAGVIHLFILMLVPQRKPFVETVRVFAFAYSPLLFAIVPFIGSFAGGVWSLVLVVIGLREVHHTTTGRAVSAVLIPLLIVMLIGVFMALIVGLVGVGVQMAV